MRTLSTCVTLLKFIRLGSAGEDCENEYLVAGIGNQIYVYSKNLTIPLVREDILPPGVRVHGISEERNNIVAIHGGRHVALVRLLFEGQRLISVLREDIHEFDDWVWDTQWFSGNELVAVACGHSKTAICLVADLSRSIIMKSEEKELTWSTRLFPSRNRDCLRAAAGSSFGDVLVWSVIPYSEVVNVKEALNANRQPPDLLQPVHRLSGHDGPVMRLEVSADTRYMVTASVDRSVRVWKQHESGNCAACGKDGCYEIQLVNYGHLARVWDVAFLTDKGPSVVSVAEDRTCRVWSAEGQEEAVFHGHSGRNVWSLDVSTSETGWVQIATGGEDGAIKIRKLPYSKRKNAVVASEGYQSYQFSLPGNYPNPRKTGGAYNEGSRTISFVGKDAALISTDFGRVLFCRQDTDGASLLWKELYRDEIGRAYTPSSLCTCGAFAFAGQTSGNVTVLHTATHDFEQSVKVLDICALDSMVMGVFAEKYHDEIHIFVASPDGNLSHWRLDMDGLLKAMHCGTYRMKRTVKTSLVTAVSVVESRDVVLVGDRGGRVLLYKLQGDGSTGFPLEFCRPHKDRISSIRALGHCTFQTAGFDGQIIELTLEPKLAKTREYRAQEHVDTIAKVMSSLHGDLIVGFRGAELVVWNQKQNSEMIRMNVGNWRRAHDIHMEDAIVKFLYWRAGSLHLLRCNNMSVVSLGADGHGGRINCMKLCGDEVLTGSDDTLIMVWKVQDGMWKCVQRLQRHISAVNDLVIQDESMVSVGGCDEVIFWKRGSSWKHESTTQVGNAEQEDTLQRAMCVAFWRDCVVVGRSNGSVYQVAENRIQGKLVGQCKGAILCITTTSDGFVCGDTNGYITLFTSSTGDMATVRRTDQWMVHQNGINCISLQPHGSRLQVISGGDDETVCCSVLDKEEMEEVWTGKAGCAAVTGVTCFGEYVIRIGADQRVIAWKDGVYVGSTITDVADCSSVIVMNSHLVISGMGLQLIPINSISPSLQET